MQQLLLELSPPPSPTLENFFPGRNGAALGALRAALAGGEPCVYLWGAPGSGKTHLLHAFARASGADAAYFQTARADWKRLETLNKIAIDDVFRLDEPGQTAVFDLCNRLRASGGALVASGTMPPAELALRADLRSRLGSGIVLQLHPLGDAEKARALGEHAAGRGLAMDESLIGYLLTHFERDMGTQIALLDALDRYSLQRQRGITLPLLKEVLQQLRAAR